MVDKNPPKLTSKQVRTQIKKTLIKFKAHTCEPKGPNPDWSSVQAWMDETEEIGRQAASWLKAYDELDEGEFCEALELAPLSTRVLYRLIGLALVSDDPDKPSKLGKATAKTNEPEKEEILKAWAVWKAKPGNKFKSTFSTHWTMTHPKGLKAGTILMLLRHK